MSKILDFVKQTSLISAPTPYDDKNYKCISGWKSNNFLQSMKLYDNPDYKDWNGVMIDLNGLYFQYIILDVDCEKANKLVIEHCKEHNYNIVSTPSYSNINCGHKYKNHYWFKKPKTDMQIKKKISKDYPEMEKKFGLLDILIQIAEHKNSIIDYQNISELSEESLRYFYMTEDEEESDDESIISVKKEEHSEDKIKDLLKLLSPTRGDTHNDFLSIGSALKAIDKDFVILFDNFCKKRKNYKDSKEISFRWNGFPRNQGIGTLINMAKIDNPEKYQKWRAKYCKPEVKEERAELKEKLEKLDEDEYSKMKVILEKNLFMTTEPICYYFINDENKPFAYDKTDIKDLLAPKKIGKKSFFDLWITDENKRQYKKLDFCPLSTNPKIFNTFTGFKYDNDKPINYDKINPFINLIKELLNNDEASIKAFLDWCAWIRQRPNVKSNKAIVLYSEVQGVGKNTILQLLTSIFTGYTSKVERIEELIAKFNSHLSSQLFIYGDEIQAKAREIREELKNMITRDEMKVEPKGFNSYIMKDYSNYIFTTNNRDAFFIEATDRRFYMFDLCNKVMTDETAEKLYSLLKEEETLTSFDTYLKNRPLPVRLEKITNKYKESLISNSLPAYIKMVYDNIDLYSDAECTVSKLFKRAQQYAKENALQWTFSKDKFQKDFKKEFKEFYKRTMLQVFYRFPIKKELIKILLSKRKELMTEYIIDDEAELVSEEESEAETNDLNL
jgi:hypothetical protein